MKNSVWVIGARFASAISGYLILALAANHLDAAEFAALSTAQACIFLLQVFFDSGITQLATRDTAGSPLWTEKASHFQDIRLVTHIVLATGTVGFFSIGAIPGISNWMALAAVLVILSNALVMDWLLYSRGHKRLWAIKTLASSSTNVAVTALLLSLLDSPEPVLLGIAFSNITGWLYLRRKKLVNSFALSIPSRMEIYQSSQLALNSALFHTAYNAPLLLATYLSDDKILAKFALLYRLFSASSMFIPTLVDFAVAREIAKLKSQNRHAHLKVFLKLAAISLLACCPILILPNHLIHAAFSLAIDLEKFQITPEKFTAVKIALTLYCIDFCGQRTAYIFDQSKLLFTSATSGLLVAGAMVLLNFTQANTSSSHFDWFHPLFAYQAVSAAIILTGISRSRHQQNI